MGDKTGIGWTDRTWNCWQGCTKVSPACKHCYMFRDKYRFGQDPTTVIRSKPQTFNLPMAMYGPRSTKGTPGEWKWPDGDRVFTCSWSDWFHKDADEWRDDAWAIVKQRPGLIFQILTKRPERIAAHLPADWGDGYPNVWLGATVENQKYADERIPLLTAIPAAVRFISYEPALGPITGLDGLDWVISGGESGPKARPSDPAWHRAARDECNRLGIPFFFKQWGAYDEHGVRRGTAATGKVLDGKRWCEFPNAVV